MRFLESWVITPLAQALGWTLLHSLWEGAILSAFLGTVLWAARSARARYAAACVAMLVMLGAVGITLIRVMPERVQGLPGAETTLPPWNVPPDLGAAGPSGSRLAAVVPWLAPFWIAGVWIFVLGQVAGWIWVSQLRRRGVCCAPEHLQKEIERLSALLRVSKPVQILESCLADVPMVLGHIRPVILMPIGLLAGLPPRQIEVILLHELAHIRRYDYLVNVLQRAVECVLFYHPAVWWISRVMRTERESCCDDVVVATSGNVREYADALAALEANRWSSGEPVLAATGGNLMKRIRRLLYPNPRNANGVWTPFLAAALLIATTVVTLAEWPQEPAEQSSVAAQQQAEATLAFPVQPLAHFRMTANSQKVFETLGGLANMNVTFTPDFRPSPISIDLTNVKLQAAFVVVARQTKTFLKPIATNTILVIPDTQENRRAYVYINHGLLSAADGESHDGNEENRPALLKRAEGSPYDRWLNEEVPYIITDSERAAFKKLTTDEKREQFIEQFWERRNPNPRSPENEFKEEYYRRIAYANGHWATDRPGWKTDRGHMYIVYGPPDEIDSHLSGPPYPIEEWKYNYIKGLGSNVVFKFIDPKETGEYQLVSPPWSHRHGEFHVPLAAPGSLHVSLSTTRGLYFSNQTGCDMRT